MLSHVHRLLGSTVVYLTVMSLDNCSEEPAISKYIAQLHGHELVH